METEGTTTTTLGWQGSLTLLFTTGRLVKKEGRVKRGKAVLSVGQGERPTDDGVEPREKPCNTFPLGLSKASCWFIQVLQSEDQRY